MLVRRNCPVRLVSAAKRRLSSDHP
jgi:hypothetical protein